MGRKVRKRQRFKKFFYEKTLQKNFFKIGNPFVTILSPDESYNRGKTGAIV